MAMDHKVDGLQRLSQKRIDQFRDPHHGVFIHFGMPTFHGITLDGRRFVVCYHGCVGIYSGGDPTKELDPESE